MTTADEILQVGARWVDAEQRCDADALDALTTDDFAQVGPVGFVLDKQVWLEHHRSGAFRIESLSWDEVAVRDYGTAAVAIGKQTQQAQFQGQRADGTFRSTHIYVRGSDGTWRLAGAHVGMLGGPPPFAAGGAAGGAAGAGTAGAGAPAS